MKKEKTRKLAKAIAEQVAMSFMEQLPKQVRRRSRRDPVKRSPPSPAKAVATPSTPPSSAVNPRIKFSPEALQASRRKRRPQVLAFSTPSFPAELTKNLPSGREMAQDSAIAAANEYAIAAFNGLPNGVFAEGLTFLGYPYLSELTQRPEYRVIVETIATEMTRAWIEIQVKGDEDKTEKIEQLEAEMKRLKVQEVFEKSAETDGYFGRAHLYIDTGDTEDPEELKTPIGDGRNALSKAKIRKGSIRRLAVIEPVWTYPMSYNSFDPLKEDWYSPQTWFVQSKEVHVSRLLRFVGREVPDLLKPAYAFGGLALTQIAKPYVDNWLNVRQSVADIIQAFTVFVLKTTMAEQLSPSGEELFNRVDVFNNLRDSRGTMVIDKESEDFQNVSAPLGTLDALQAQAQEHMASVSRIPLVKLLGISPHGLNATAEPEIRVFYDSILAAQKKFFAPNLDIIFAMAQLNIWGEVDPDLSYNFKPLWSLDEKEEAEVRKLNAETGQILVETGSISQEEERKRVASDPKSPYQGLDVNDMPDLEDEEQDGLDPGACEHDHGNVDEKNEGDRKAA